MRTAARVALVLTGTSMFVATMAMPVARAGADRVDAITASQRARPQSRPDRIDYVQAAEVRTMATAIAHLSSAPEVANAVRGKRMRTELAAVSDHASDTSATSPIPCNGDTFVTQQRNASDGGRGPVAEDSVEGSCPEDDKPKPRTRQAIVGGQEQPLTRTRESASAVLTFEAVIKIDLAGLSW